MPPDLGFKKTVLLLFAEGSVWGVPVSQSPQGQTVPANGGTQLKTGLSVGVGQVRGSAAPSYPHPEAGGAGGPEGDGGDHQQARP